MVAASFALHQLTKSKKYFLLYRCICAGDFVNLEVIRFKYLSGQHKDDRNILGLEAELRWIVFYTWPSFKHVYALKQGE
jgi:hypothetical protein